MKKEHWRIVPGWDNYMVSDLGRVKSLDFNHTGKEEILKQYKTGPKGRLQVWLYKDGEKRPIYVHVLVAMAFIPNPENKPIVHHIDENPANNCVDNLMWVTPEEHNEIHNSTGTRSKKISEKKTNGKTSKKVRQMTPERVEITIWPSTREIERSKGWSHGNIGTAIKKGTIAYGCLWEYVEN